MFKLIQYSYTIQKTLRNGSTAKNYGLGVKFWENIRQGVDKTSKNCFMGNNTSGRKLFKNALLHNFTTISILSGTAYIISKNHVFCKEKTSRLVGYQSLSGKHIRFDWKQFWHYLKPYIGYFIAAVLGALAVAIVNVYIPKIMADLVNVIAKMNGSMGSESFVAKAKDPVLKLLGMYIVQSMSTFFYIHMLSMLGERIAFDMKTDLFHSILNQDIAFFDHQRTGEIIHRLTADVQEFKSSFKQIVPGGLRAATQIIGSGISLLFISPQMTFVTLLCVPSVIAVGTLFGAVLRVILRKSQAQTEKATAVADEAVGNIKTIRAFAMEDQENDLFRSEAAEAMILSQKLGLGIAVFQAGTNMFLNSVVLSTLYMGGYLLSTNKMSAGEVMAFLMASQTIQRSLAQVSLLFGSVVRGAAAGARVFEYINMKPSILLKGGEIIQGGKVKGGIEFRNVSFAYPTRKEQKVLDNFNLKIPSGKTVAIVGSSGSGKSTIVALIERFYDVNDGVISLDGHDVRTLDPSWLRKEVLGLISQEPILFGTSIIENIRYGKPDATDEEVREAAKLANADDFVQSFPKGYDTVVGERGSTLSGGQKQRIAIARALLKNPCILLLDEATSALDTESEKLVQVALDKAQKGRTVIVIAHRLSTIQNADLIVVLNKGQIIEMGTHESLKKKRGYYWSLTYQQENSPAG